MSIKGVKGFKKGGLFLLFKNDVKLSISMAAWKKIQKGETNQAKKIIVYICNYDKYSTEVPLVTLATEEEALEGDKPDFKNVTGSKVFNEIKEDKKEGDKSIKLKGDYLKNNGFTFAISEDANKEMTTDRVMLYQYLPNCFVLALNKEIDTYEKLKNKDEGSSKGLDIDDANRMFKFQNLKLVEYIKACLMNSGTKFDDDDD